MPCHDLAYVRNFLQCFGIRVHQGFQIAEMRCERRGRGVSHFANSQGYEKTGQTGVSAFLYRQNQIFGRFRSHSLEFCQFFGGQPVEIGHILHGSRIDELFNQLLAQPLDIHRRARSEMSDRLPALGRTDQTGVAAVLYIAVEFHGRVARRASLRHFHFAALVSLLDHLNDLRNDVAGPAHNDGVSNAKSEPFDFVHVVQGRIGDRDAADEDRLEAGDRRNRSHASDLEINGEHPGAFFLGGEFPGDRPTRAAGSLPEFPLQVQAIDLDDRTVDFVVEIRAFFEQSAAIFQACAGAGAELAVGIGFQAPLVEQGKCLEQRFRQVETFRDAEAVAIHLQGEPGGIARIELADGARRGIARVDISPVLFFPGPFVQCGKSLLAQKDFAANLDSCAGEIRSLKAQRNVMNRADVMRDIFAVYAVPASRAAFKSAVAVHQADRDTVDLGLAAIFDGAFNPRPLQGACFELNELFLAEGFFQRQHGNFMTDFDKSGQRFAAYALGWRIRALQTVSGFEFFQFRQQGVELGIGNPGPIQRMVLAIVKFDLFPERVDFPPDRGRRIVRDTHGRPRPRCLPTANRLFPYRIRGCAAAPARFPGRSFPAAWNRATGRPALRQAGALSSASVQRRADC